MMNLSLLSLNIQVRSVTPSYPQSCKMLAGTALSAIIKDFVDNPDVVTNVLRSWLKEE